MSGDYFTVITKYIDQKLYVPKEESFPLPLKYLAVMRSSRPSTDDVSQHTPSDCGDAESKVARSEEWVGTKRLHTVRIKLP